MGYQYSHEKNNKSPVEISNSPCQIVIFPWDFKISHLNSQGIFINLSCQVWIGKRNGGFDYAELDLQHDGDVLVHLSRTVHYCDHALSENRWM